MKEAFLIALLISGSLVSGAQEPKIAIPMTSKDAKGFAPDGWEVEVVKKGDLNGDGIDDAAIVMMKPKVTENGETKASSSWKIKASYKLEGGNHT